MFKKIFFRKTFFKLLIQTLNVINKSEKRKFINLLILVILQAIFDVISLASLVPLIQIISDRSVLEEYLENIVNKVFNISILENNSDLSQNETYFYWENKANREAILGYGMTESCQLNIESRFRDLKKFVNNCFQKLTKVNHDDSSTSSPHVFCGFTFFSNSSNHNSSNFA